MCARCAAKLRPGAGNFYCVLIAAVADPWPPTLAEEDLARDLRNEIEQLLGRLEGLPEQDAMDQIYRRQRLYLCGACFRSWIENPVGEGA